MNPTILPGAIRQAGIDLKVQLFSWNVLGWVLLPAIGLGVVVLLDDQPVMVSGVSLAQLGVPGILTFTIISSALMGSAGQLITERDDGTLLRCKAVPGGMPSHLLGNVLILSVTTLSPTLLKDPVMLWLVGLLTYGSMAISGAFYPISALPDWLGVIGRCLPTFWIGLGYRSALLPPEAASLEWCGSWHTGQTALILVAWAAVGLLVAPQALLRLARRQSGSQVAAARDRVMARGY